VEEEKIFRELNGTPELVFNSGATANDDEELLLGTCRAG
jgi:hypothetical protein